MTVLSTVSVGKAIEIWGAHRCRLFSHSRYDNANFGTPILRPERRREGHWWWCWMHRQGRGDGARNAVPNSGAVRVSSFGRTEGAPDTGTVCSVSFRVLSCFVFLSDRWMGSVSSVVARRNGVIPFYKFTLILATPFISRACGAMSLVKLMRYSCKPRSCHCMWDESLTGAIKCT